jgi:hypothetical protein
MYVNEVEKIEGTIKNGQHGHTKHRTDCIK